ncbi:threonine-phosphate decarboxylase [Dyadobacter jejuensis]|uniref:Aminotransferase n=1 Tax=Dyadobacter jejuensis TaxID=1082580 RepID=A0A316ABE6_9BACT|nr:aminotransferase class I/II-fold pyridoxal phosphate-dependent enzyme [Dyadobacter jejuensis]PWJ55033.1 threonine-phosphate decarboxylase [Dyadobacter jejuensis]
MLHGHGNDGYRYDREIWADFSTNVWVGGEPKGLKEHLCERWKTVNAYPEVLGESLGVKIAQHHQLVPSQVLVANGTTESIYLLAQLYTRKKTCILTPSFSEYEDACRAFDHQLTFLPWPEGQDPLQLDSDLVFICNPNNPTGRTLSQLEVSIRNNPRCLFAIDEAFTEFTLFNESAVAWMSRYPNLLVMRSMTKAYAIPGLRLGYLLGQPSLIQALCQIKQPWTINALALEAGTFIFENYDSVQPPIAELLGHKEQFVHQLKALGCLDVLESCTHFFLCKTHGPDARVLKTFLLDEYGILIRDAHNFRGLTPQHFRVATLMPDQNGLLITALKEWKRRYC